MMETTNQLSVMNIEKQFEKYFQALDKALSQAFPRESYIAQNLLNLKRKTKNLNRGLYQKDLLPFHTRDAGWLIEYYDLVFKNYQAAKFTSGDNQVEDMQIIVPDFAVRLYVNTSEQFNAKRCEYETNIVKQYIKILANKNVNDFYMSVMDKSDALKRTDYDQLFRAKVENAMRYLGIDNQVVQNALEKNADMWRNKARKIAFNNTYSKSKKDYVASYKELLKVNNPHKLEQVDAAYHDFYRVWSDLADYQYYQQHKKEIDLTRTATPAMLMSSAKAKQITAEMEALGVNYEFALFDAEMTIKEILAAKKQAKTEMRASNANVSFVTAEKQKAWDEKAKYWDEHQPASNLNPYTSLNYDIEGREIIDPAKLEADQYWEEHQPEINYNPKKKVFVGKKKHNAEKEKYWEEHQPESNESRQELFERKRRTIFIKRMAKKAEKRTDAEIKK